MFRRYYPTLICCLAAVSFLTACTMPPLQTIAQPRQAIQAAAKEMPRIPDPDPAAAWVPAGYKVEVFVRDLTYPSSIEFDPDGNAYIAESGYVYGDEAAPARIWRITPRGEMRIIADQLNGPVTDILWHEGRLLISHKGKISSVDSQGSAVRDLVTGLPSFGDHENNQMTIGPDGKVYFGQGTVTNSGVVGTDNFAFGWLGKYPAEHDVAPKDLRTSGQEFLTLDPMVLTSSKEPPLVRTVPFAAFGTGALKGNIAKGDVKANGTILRMNPDGSGLEVYAWGLRNPFGVKWGPDGKLYAADNGFDDRGSRPIAHALDAIWEIRQGAWYGWPDYNAGIPVTDARFRPQHGPAPKPLLSEGDHPKVEQPIATRPNHVGVTKIDFSTSDKFGFNGQMFFAEVGDMNPITGNHVEHFGFDVIRLDPRTRQSEVFFRTKESALGPKDGRMEYVVTSGPKRLVGVKFSPAGDAMYVADIGAIAVTSTPAPAAHPFVNTGVIWKITKEGTPSKGPSNLSPLPGRSAGVATAKQ